MLLLTAYVWVSLVVTPKCLLIYIIPINWSPINDDTSDRAVERWMYKRNDAKQYLFKELFSVCGIFHCEQFSSSLPSIDLIALVVVVFITFQTPFPFLFLKGCLLLYLCTTSLIAAIISHCTTSIQSCKFVNNYIINSLITCQIKTQINALVIY